MKFAVAASLQDALTALDAGARPVAGGTDLVVAARHQPDTMPDSVIAIDRLSELAAVTESADGLQVGALVTHATLMTDPTVVAQHTALADAAALVGSPSTRSVGTLGGNIMNASPAMDTGAPLVVLDATVQLRSLTQERSLAITQLWTCPGQTAAAPAELCLGVTLPRPPANAGSAYVRLEYRRAMEIAVVGAAAAVTLNDDGSLLSAHCALSAVAPTIVAVEGLSEAVAGGPLDAAKTVAAHLAAGQAQPISDLRASDRYRRHCVGVMAARAVDAAARRAGGEQVGVPVNRSQGVGAP